MRSDIYDIWQTPIMGTASTTAIGSKALDVPFVDMRKTGAVPEGEDWNWFLLAITVLLIAGYIAFAGHAISNRYLYKPGDNIGYNLGLLGGLMMLVMLLYSLRKRAHFMKDYGILPKWFRWHMILGILGPTLVMFHSTFVIHSFNAGVALICMMLVSGSGIFGRFIYSRIHNGLYGREVSLKLMHENLAKTGSFKVTFMNFAPNIDHRLDQFRIRTESGAGGFWNSLSIEFQSAFLSISLVKELHQVMNARLREKQGDSGQTKRDVIKPYEEYAAHIRMYIEAIRNAAQFRTYERIFSLWHIFHIPLVYMLLFSGIYHVISVHMY